MTKYLTYLLDYKRSPEEPTRQPKHTHCRTRQQVPDDQDGYETGDSDTSTALTSAIEDLTISFNQVMHLIQHREHLLKQTLCIVHNLTKHFSNHEDTMNHNDEM